jgi:hypothetical protein
MKMSRFGGSLRALGGSAYREGHSFQAYSQPSQGLAPKLKHTLWLDEFWGGIYNPDSARDPHPEARCTRLDNPEAL